MLALQIGIKFILYQYSFISNEYFLSMIRMMIYLPPPRRYWPLDKFWYLIREGLTFCCGCHPSRSPLVYMYPIYTQIIMIIIIIIIIPKSPSTDPNWIESNNRTLDLYSPTHKYVSVDSHLLKWMVVVSNNLLTITKTSRTQVALKWSDLLLLSCHLLINHHPHANPGNGRAAAP